MPKTLTVRADGDTYDAFVKRAKAENRSMANFIEHAVKSHIQDHDFVDDVEMTESIANEWLVGRLKRGAMGARRWLARYRLFETAGYQADLAQLTRSGLRRLHEKLRESIYPRLGEEPHFGPNIRRLKRWEPPHVAIPRLRLAALL